MKLSIPLMIALVIFTAIGSYFQIWAVPYVVCVVVITVLVLSAFNKIPEKTYPLLLLGLALAMLWQQTMLGSYIVGTDINGEYFIANKTITSGWDWSYFHLNVTSIVINIFTPLLYKIGIPVVWQFKLIYPIVLSFVPLVLYLAFTKQFSRKISFYSALFFIIVPVFTVEIAGIVKSMVADLFFALSVYVLLSKMGNLKKTLLLTTFGLLAVMSHYTVGTVLVAYLGIIAVILIGYKIVTRKNNFIPVTIAVVIVLIVGALWLKNTGGSIVYTGYAHSLDSVKYTGVTEENLAENNQSSDGNKSVSQSEGKSYLNNQDTLVQTALGMDWNEVLVGGKIFRVIQYATQLAIVIGFCILVWKRKEYKISIEFLSGILASAIILIGVLFVPKLANVINTTRWYHFALFFISPLLVVALWKIGKQKLLVGVLVVYYVFTSGLVFALAHDNIPQSKVEVPYSIAFSAKEGIVGIFNEDDVKCAKWLVQNRNGLMVSTSYISTYLPLGYEDWFEQYQEKGILKKPYLLFLTTQDIKLGKWCNGTEAGMRSYTKLPNTNGLKELHREGWAVVYYVE